MLVNGKQTFSTDFSLSHSENEEDGSVFANRRHFSIFNEFSRRKSDDLGTQKDRQLWCFLLTYPADLLIIKLENHKKDVDRRTLIMNNRY